MGQYTKTFKRNHNVNRLLPTIVTLSPVDNDVVISFLFHVNNVCLVHCALKFIFPTFNLPLSKDVRLISWIKINNPKNKLKLTNMFCIF